MTIIQANILFLLMDKLSLIKTYAVKEQFAEQIALQTLPATAGQRTLRP